MKYSYLEKIIKEHVENVLSEQSDENYIADDPLVQTFIRPFTDVIQTAKHGVEKISRITQHNAKNIAGSIAASLIPFMSWEISEETEQKFKQKLSEIDEEYREVLERNKSALQGRDTWGITFLLNPTLGLGTYALRKSPIAALDALESLSGGADVVRDLKQKAQDTLGFKTPGDEFSQGGVSSMGLGTLGGGGGIGGESYNPSLAEQQTGQKQQEQDPEEEVMNMIQNTLQDPKVQQQIANSEATQQMRQVAYDIVNEMVEEVLKIDDWESLKKYMDNEASKLEQQLNNSLPEEASDEEIDMVKDELIDQFKQYYIDVLAKQLDRIAEKSPSIKKDIQKLKKKLQSKSP